jgi:hypothetical protein
MRTSLAIAVIVALLPVAAPNAAGQAPAAKALHVRLLSADNSGGGTKTAGIEDVLPQLRRNLRFNTYRLLVRRSVPLKAGARTRLGRGLSLTIVGADRGAVTIALHRGDARLMQTRLQLAKGKPVSLGGIPGEGEERLIVVVSQP